MLVFHNIWKKYDKIQLTKNKMDLNNQKIKNHPPSPVFIIYLFRIIKYLTLLGYTFNSALVTTISPRVHV